MKMAYADLGEFRGELGTTVDNIGEMDSIRDASVLEEGSDLVGAVSGVQQ